MNHMMAFLKKLIHYAERQMIKVVEMRYRDNKQEKIKVCS